MDRTIEPSARVLDGSDDGVTLESLPKEVGVFLIVVGIGGILLPGPVGAPLLVLGGVILFPRVFHKMDQGLQKRFPKTHRQSMKRVRRFVVDLERRYPSRAGSGTGSV